MPCSHCRISTVASQSQDLCLAWTQTGQQVCAIDEFCYWHSCQGLLLKICVKNIQWPWGYHEPCTIYSKQHKQQYGLRLRQFVYTNSPLVGFELRSLGPQAGVLLIELPLVVYNKNKVNYKFIFFWCFVPFWMLIIFLNEVFFLLELIP